MQCTHLASVIFLSAATLYDTDVGWLLNTLLCMFYECDDYSNSTSEPVVCQGSQRCILFRDFTSAWHWGRVEHLKTDRFFLFLQSDHVDSGQEDLTFWVYRDDFASLSIIIGDHDFFNHFTEHYQHSFFFTWNVSCDLLQNHTHSIIKCCLTVYIVLR